jgi:hypothetical protein
MKRSALLAALVLLAASGLIFHYRIHYFMVPAPDFSEASLFDRTLFLASLLPLLDLVLVTALFLSRRTAVYGYLLNGFIVILGTILMVHFSMTVLADRSLSPGALVLNSTLPDIGIAWADFFLGKALYEWYLRGS